MWLSKRKFLLSTLSLAGLSACGFSPVYAPGGSGNRLLNQVALDAPEAPNDYLFNRRFEERMGRASGPYLLSVSKSVDQQDLGSTTTGNTTRYRLLGRANYVLKDATGAILTSGKTDAFSGYSTTGSTVATLAAERDASERLMILLADQVIDKLILSAGDWPNEA
ncbi:LPS assembly lipoprotein LptE [Pacificoceanicola onchidii]|uniref:LPS assembly lipoprotein LptE n=1 Tax=Pacificoceanicola onchidii TaxID=2562685 RepID=UPI0010A3C08E|nr:LPS assembly lipoprotein LptE [Pacificoceanicola onchidii]